MKSLSFALALLSATAASAEVTKGSYDAETFWVNAVQEDGCIRTSTYVVLTFDRTKKSSVPPSLLVSRYVDDTCTGEYLLSAYGILENPWTTQGAGVSVTDMVQVEGMMSGDATYSMEVHVDLTWTGASNKERWWSNSGYEGACFVSTSTYDQTSWVADVSGTVDGLSVDSFHAGKTLYNSSWSERPKKC